MILWSDFYNAQKNFQEYVCKNIGYHGEKKEVNLPIDDPKIASYHIQQLVSEIGEILSADKRWKNYRNDKCDKENKIEEIADCFIVLANIALYSGINEEEMLKTIFNKMHENRERIGYKNE